MSTQLTNAKRPRKVALVNRKAAPSRRWHSAQTHPPRRGWYECRRVDGREISGDAWDGCKTDWCAWGCGQWWNQLKDGWIGKPEWEGQYQWRGPAKSIALDYHQLPELGAREVAA